MQTTLTTKGQMTLPQAVRLQLGLHAGDQLAVAVIDDDTITLRRKLAPSVASLRGILPKPTRALSIEEMNAGVTRYLGQKHGVRKK